MDHGVIDVGKERNDDFKEEDTRFPINDFIVILLDETNGVFCTSPKIIYWLHFGSHMEQKLLERFEIATHQLFIPFSQNLKLISSLVLNIDCYTNN